MMAMVVAIDGPAGVGKSTLAKKIASRWGFFYLNSGAFYRAIAVKIVEMKLQYSSEEKIIDTAKDAILEIRDNVLHLDGKPVEDRLRNTQIDHYSSVFSSIIPIRHIVNNKLREISADISLVAEGRDMTTVVFPAAEVKVYLDAKAEERAMRRYRQEATGVSLSEIESSMRQRDDRDRKKAEGALIIAEDAVVVDTTSLTLEQVYEKVNTLIQERSC